MLSTIGSVASQNSIPSIVTMNTVITLPTSGYNNGDAEYPDTANMYGNITLKTYSPTTGDLTVDYSITLTCNWNNTKTGSVILDAYNSLGVFIKTGNIYAVSDYNKSQLFTGSTTINIGAMAKTMNIRTDLYYAGIHSLSYATVSYTFPY